MTMFLGFENSQNPVGKVRCSIYIVTHTVTAPYRVVCSIEVWRSACNLVSVAPATALDPCSSCNWRNDGAELGTALTALMFVKLIN